MGASETSEGRGRRVSTTGDRVNAARAISVLASDEVMRRRLASMLRNTPFRAGVYVLAESGGIERTLYTVRLLREEQPHAKIVVVAPDDDARRWHRLLDAGADGVVPEERLESLLAATVAAACAGLVTLPREQYRPHTPVLSPREKQVLGLVVLGLANAEIARKLHLEESTVKSHLSSIFRKLGVRSRSEAAARVLDARNGLGLGILTISDTRA